MQHVSANPLLDAIEALQDQVLADLDQLNRRIESVLKSQLAMEIDETGFTSAEPPIEAFARRPPRRDLPVCVEPPHLHLTTFLPAPTG